MFSPEWHALGREAQLAAELTAAGVTTLGRANYAQQGYYIQAFFNLSTGLERLGKLVFVCDHAIESNGRFPNDNDLRRLGHSIQKLVQKSREIANRRQLKLGFAAAPIDPIHSSIIDILDKFGRSTRYYNLDLVSGADVSRDSEPIQHWWNRVGQPILDRHYSKKRRERDERAAAAMSALIGHLTFVLHTREDGTVIDDFETASRLTGATAVVQKYGRLYVLQIIRWMSRVLAELSFLGGYTKKIDALAGLNEPFALFYNEDQYFLGRKTWSIYRP